MPNSYESAFTMKRLLISAALIAMIPTLLTVMFAPGVTPRLLLVNYGMSLVYSICIGSLATFVLTRVWGWLAPRSRVFQWSVTAVVLVVVTAVGCLLAGGLFVLLGLYEPRMFWHYYLQGLKLALLISFIFGGGATLFEMLRAELHATTLELRTRELERERALKLATEARLSSLESRVHPHFLFNALNSISSLIREEPERAEKLLERMAELLRFSLESSRAGLVNLDQEMRLVADYLEIETARHGARLRYSIDVPSDLEPVEVPPLSVQTLVENSVKYAVAVRREGGMVRVTARRHEGRVEIAVWDDGPGFSIDSVRAGHGLDNLQSRLLVLFSGAAALDIQRDESGTRVTISVPQTQGAAAK
ncbi:MAG: sensor histidine kinase [Bryobacteraceae bacterium]